MAGENGKMERASCVTAKALHFVMACWDGGVGGGDTRMSVVIRVCYKLPCLEQNIEEFMGNK